MEYIGPTNNHKPRENLRFDFQKLLTDYSSQSVVGVHEPLSDLWSCCLAQPCIDNTFFLEFLSSWVQECPEDCSLLPSSMTCGSYNLPLSPLHSVPWALWKGRAVDTPCTAEHFSVSYSLQNGHLWVPAHHLSHKEMSPLRMESGTTTTHLLCKILEDILILRMFSRMIVVV